MGARRFTPASKSMVAPRAMKILMLGILSFHVMIYFSCLGAPTPTTRTLAPLALTVLMICSHSWGFLSNPMLGDSAPTMMSRPTLLLMRSFAFSATLSKEPRRKMRQSGLSRWYWVERPEKRTPRDGFLDWRGSETGAEQDHLAVAHHPVGFLVGLVKLLVFLEFHHMVYVGCEEHTLFEAGE